MVNAEPHRISVMLHLLGQSELPLQQRAATRSIDDPACLDLAFFALMEQGEVMMLQLRLQADMLDLAAIEKMNAPLWQLAAQSILQSSTIQLVRPNPMGRKDGMSKL